MRALLSRVRRSPFADDLRAAARGAFWPAVVCSGVIVGFALLVLTRGQYVTWDGLEPIPTTSA